MLVPKETEVLDPLEMELLELRTVSDLPTWVLGTELGSSVRRDVLSISPIPYIDSLAN